MTLKCLQHPFGPYLGCVTFGVRAALNVVANLLCLGWQHLPYLQTQIELLVGKFGGEKASAFLSRM